MSAEISKVTAYARLNHAVKCAGGTRAFARRHQLSAAYVSDVRLGRRHLTGRIAEAIGLKVAVVINRQARFFITAGGLPTQHEDAT